MVCCESLCLPGTGGTPPVFTFRDACNYLIIGGPRAISGGVKGMISSKALNVGSVAVCGGLKL